MRKKNPTDYVVLVDGWIVDRIFDGPDAGERAAQYANHCNRNYQGSHTAVPARGLNMGKYCEAIGIKPQ